MAKQLQSYKDMKQAAAFGNRAKFHRKIKGPNFTEKYNYPAAKWVPSIDKAVLRACAF